MAKPIDYEVELLLEVVELTFEFPGIPLLELASGLERRAAVYDNGPRRALAVAAELRRQAAASKPQA